MKISIVTTLYQSAPYLQEFYKRAKKAAQKITDDFEIILVDDGSPDDSLDVALEIQQQDNRVMVIELSRNFGHHKAMMTGLSYASGDFVFLLDSDLEEEPEWLELFYKTLQEQKCDVVYGVQRSRKGGWFERLTGELFYRFMNFCSSLNLTRNLVNARLMKYNYAKSLLKFTEHELFMAGVWKITGYKQYPVNISKGFKGRSSYSIRKKAALALNAITSFTSKPLYFISYVGFFVSTISFIYIIYLLTRSIFFASPVSGWASLIVSIWFLGGLIIFFVGILGLYVAKIFMEVKQRPYTIVRQVYQHEEN